MSTEITFNEAEKPFTIFFFETKLNFPFVLLGNYVENYLDIWVVCQKILFKAIKCKLFK